MEANLTTAAVSAIEQAQVQNDASLAVAQKALQIQKQQGQAAVELVKQAQELSAQLSAGRIDVRL